MDLKAAYDEFSHLKVQEQRRNDDYYLLRQAVKGNFRWPRDWPVHIPRITHNLCKPITERFTHYLMGKGFTYNVDRPNTLEYREAAERTEKILRRVFALSKSKIQFDMGAKSGSQLGRTVFKVYKKGAKGAEHACFSVCQPDYFYGISAGDGSPGEWATVYYSYPIDITEAKRLYGADRQYKSEGTANQAGYYNPLPEAAQRDDRLRDRRVPVLEIWTKDEYALIVGEAVIFNGENPYKWKATGEGFIPFTVIENIRNAGEGRGEADIGQARELNETLNRLISRKSHIVNRYLQPTLVWEGAPPNYTEVLSQTIAGGGAIPARMGSKLYFLSHDKPNPAVLELEAALRAAILESSGMSEIALQGTVSGSVNTGPALAAQFQPVLSTVEKKRQEWDYGLQDLCAKLLEIQEQIGDSKVLGQAVINETYRSEDDSDGELVPLSGKDIQGLREVVINWPGVLPKDDIEASRLEMEKAAQGFQSIYTTLEKMGEEYPADELARIRQENQDPALRGEKVAEQLRAQAPMMKAQAEVEAMQHEQMAGEAGWGEEEALPPEEDSLAARLRMLERGPVFDDAEDEPVIGFPEVDGDYGLGA